MGDGPRQAYLFDSGTFRGDNKRMQLFFEVAEGEKVGSRFEIRPGMTIGRKNADIELPDPKVSIRHATVESSGNDSLYLVDAGSSNGLKVDGLKVAKVHLMPGARVRIGRTVLRVLDLTGEPQANVIPENETWLQAMTRLAVTAKGKFKSRKNLVQPFNPLIELKIMQGRQSGTEWLIGYGPRQVGHKTLDLRLEEPGSPDICFELVPHRDGPKFQTAYPDIVKLNGRSVKASTVGDGDIIEIHKTKIAISLKADD